MHPTPEDLLCCGWFRCRPRPLPRRLRVAGLPVTVLSLSPALAEVHGARAGSLPGFHSPQQASAAPPAGPDEVVLAGALTRAEAERLREEEPDGGAGLVSVLASERSLDPLAGILGHEILGIEGRRLRSWIEDGLVDTVAEALGIRPDAHGLVADRRDAEAAADHLNREDLGGPVIWRPWVLACGPGGIPG